MRLPKNQTECIDFEQQEFPQISTTGGHFFSSFLYLECNKYQLYLIEY